VFVWRDNLFLVTMSVSRLKIELQKQKRKIKFISTMQTGDSNERDVEYKQQIKICP